MSKRKAYTVEKKMEILQRIQNKESRAKICKETGLSESTLRGWLKNEDKLREFADQVDEDYGLSRKKARSAQDPVLDKEVFNWFIQARSEGVPVSGPIIINQAEMIQQKLHGTEDGCTSRGWLDRWKVRHGVKQIKVCGESRSADTTAAAEFLLKFEKFFLDQQLSVEQVYNCDETALFFKILPEKTLAYKKDSSSGHKAIKDRVTLLFACNWTGSHKLKPLVIGKFKSPRCFHHLNMENLPALYKNSKNAWMTTSIFELWFQEDFVPAVRKHLRRKSLEERAVLLLDNCPAHPPASILKTGDGKITVYYLPKNTTSKIQPLDQGIICNFKQNYRTGLTKSFLYSGNPKIEQFLKKLSLKDAIYLIDAAWKDVAQATVLNCWNHAMAVQKNQQDLDSDLDNEEFKGFTEEEATELEKKFENFKSEPEDSVTKIIDTWAYVDEDAPTVMPSDEVTDEEEEKEEEIEPEIQSNLGVSKKCISSAEAVEYTTAILHWAETHNLGALKIFQAQDFVRIAKKMRYQAGRQLTLQEAFSKKK